MEKQVSVTVSGNLSEVEEICSRISKSSLSVEIMGVKSSLKKEDVEVESAEEEKPRKRRVTSGANEAEDDAAAGRKPRRKSKPDIEDEEETEVKAPRKRRSSADDEDEEKPRKRRSDPEDDEEKAVTLEDVRKKFTAVSQNMSESEVEALFDDYGIGKLAELPKKEYSKFLKDLSKF
jgi:hypothetical protein